MSEDGKNGDGDGDNTDAFPNAPRKRVIGTPFQPGNKFGQGNPHLRHVDECVMALRAAISPQDVRICVQRLKEIRDNDKSDPKEVIKAASELLNRSCGKAVERVISEQVGPTAAAELLTYLTRRQLEDDISDKPNQ